jgi:hypothetical protein
MYNTWERWQYYSQFTFFSERDDDAECEYATSERMFAAAIETNGLLG